MKRVVKVFLSMGEEKLACFFTAYYEIDIEEKDIRESVQKEEYPWLNYVWAFRKNNIE